MSSSPEHITPDQAHAMLTRRSHRWLPPTLVLVLLLIGAGLYAVGLFPKREARAQVQARAERQAAEPRRLLTATVRQADDVLTLQQPATLEPARRAGIFAQVAGYLVERRVDIGDKVEEGQILGVIAAPLVEKELREAQSDRAVATAAVAEAEQARELAERTMERLREAGLTGAASRQDLDNAETGLRATTASLDRARAGVDAIDARIQRLQRQLEFRELQAPFPGVVTRRTRDQGDFIEFGGNPNDPAVFTIVDTTTLRTVVRAPQAQAYLIRLGQQASVRIGGLGATPVAARVSRISSEIDPATRTMPIEVEVPNADGRLIAGSYATVEIRTTRDESQRPAIIPANALMLLPTTPEGGGPTVAVITGAAGQNTLAYRSVKLGRDFGNNIEILSGVTPGERIALNLPIPLAPDTRIEPADPAATSP